MNARKWMMEYGVAMVLAFLLAMVLGQIPLFRETAVGKLRASDLVQFIGYGGALAIAWMGARQLAKKSPEELAWLAPFQAIILPLVTLLVVAIGYGVSLFVAGPFLGKSGKTPYNWVFIAGIVSCSAWLILNWVKKCAVLVAEKDSRKLQKGA
ncbi:MAG: hypothetical protein HP492_10940 [Nitrospira sp.]|nr:hypothetical protein [Nitrospira sp.]MBH0206026.1 hypothetical protein [Nitrospira sp.]